MFRVLPIFERKAITNDLVISCIDYRIQQGVQMLISQHLQIAGKTDIFLYPGSALQFILNRQVMI